MKSYVILNPAAGRGQAGRLRPAIERQLHGAGIEYELVTTHARGGATELTFQALLRNFDRIVAVGGDGTINEVVNGLVSGRATHSRAALGIIPIGTGSDFVKVVDGLKANDIGHSVRLLAEDRRHVIDLARIAVDAGQQKLNRVFINGLGIGLDAAVAVEAMKLTRLRGFAIYLTAVVRALMVYHPGVMTVRYDQHELSRELFFASVANGRCQGGGFWLTPEALIDDGWLDLCIVDRVGWGKVIRYIPRIMRGTHTRLAEVTMGRARRVEVTCAVPFPVATDGEVIATDARRVLVDVLPGALELVA